MAPSAWFFPVTLHRLTTPPPNTGRCSGRPVSPDSAPRDYFLVFGVVSTHEKHDTRRYVRYQSLSDKSIPGDLEASAPKIVSLTARPLPYRRSGKLSRIRTAYKNIPAASFFAL